MKKRTIFIVDDEPLTAQMLSDHLESKPRNKVSVFGTGEECIRNLDQEPDVVILDYRLNNIDSDAADGLEILQQIKAIDSSIMVIMFSAQEQYGKAMQTIVKGAVEYVVKDNNAFSRIDSILEAQL